MAIEFPKPPSPENPTTSPFYDENKQKWVWNGKNWVRQAADPGISDSPDDGQQYGRVRDAGEQVGQWELAYGDTWYLGAHDTAPILDEFGASLKTGMTYWNTVNEKMYAWTGKLWSPFSSILKVNTIAEYVWDSSPQIDPGDLIVWPDDYGNESTNWINGETFITVYVDGKRLIHEYDATKVTGDYTIDYVNDTIIIVNTSIPANARLVIQEGVIQKSDHISVSDNNASGFAFVINEDDMKSDLDTHLPTQQSVKAYVDAQIIKALDEIKAGSGLADFVRPIIGSIFDYAGNGVPIGALACMGQEVPIIKYPELYAVLQDTWATTGGVDFPSPDNFRLPPQTLNGIGLHTEGVANQVDVGIYHPASNLRHTHDTTGSGSSSTTGTVGNHSHSMSFGTGGFANGSAGLCLLSGGGSGSASKGTSSNGSHSHSVSLTGGSSSIGNEGELTARPESIAVLKCIWVDLQEGEEI